MFNHRFIVAVFCTIIINCILLGNHQAYGDGEFKCPTSQFYLFPCRCLSGGYKGLNLLCENSNLATLALALTNVKSPLESLVIDTSNITRLIGPLFKEKSVYSLTFSNTNLNDIEPESLSCLKQDIRSLQFDGAKFTVLPDAINVLPNLTRIAFINTGSISEVKGTSFKKIVNLIELDLHNNSIKKIESSTLSPLTLLGKFILFCFVLFPVNVNFSMTIVHVHYTNDILFLN